MAKGYLPVQRDQGFLLPLDMRDWLPADHQVWLVIEVVSEHLDTSAFHAMRRLGGVGRAGYDPDMMLTLLIWSYAQGVRSSRRIERLCHQDIAFRIICGGNLPDHVAVARFRAEFHEAVKDLFTEVLVLCARLGMGSLATITLDGTKVAANASRSANRSREWLAEQAARVVDEHAATDAEQDVLWGQGSCPDRVPADLLTDDEQDEHPGGQPASAGGDAGKGGADDSPARRRGRAGRAARIAAALAQTQAEDAERAQRQHAADAERAAAAQEYLKAQAGGAQGTGRPPEWARLEAARARLARLQANQLEKIESWNHRVAQARAAGRRGLNGPGPTSLQDNVHVRRARTALEGAEQAERERQDKQQGQPGDQGDLTPAGRNITDLDSRVMPTRNGWTQGYNAQNVLSEDGLILAEKVTQTPGDVQWFQPMTQAGAQSADLINSTHIQTAVQQALPCTCPDPATQTPDTPAPAASGPGPHCRHHPDPIGVMLTDAGYLSVDNLTAPGPDRLIAVGKHRDLIKAARASQAADPSPPDHPSGNDPAGEDPITQMARRLATPEGIATYNRRGHIAETPHGHIKHNLGLRQFSLRGLTKVQAEWTFACSLANLFKALPLLPRPTS